MDEVIHRTIVDKQNSIEVSKNSKGEIQYSIKVYFNVEDSESAIKQLEIIQHKIKEKFEKVS